MKELFILIAHLLTTLVRLAQPGGVRAVAAQSLALRHQLLVLQRRRQRTPADPMGSSVLRSVALVVAESANEGFDSAVTFDFRAVSRSLGPLQVPIALYLQAPRKTGAEMSLGGAHCRRGGDETPKSEVRCLKIAQQISYAFGVEVSKDVVRRTLQQHYAGLPHDNWLTALAHAKDSLWSLDLFPCESIMLQRCWVMAIIDLFSQRFVGFAVERGDVDGPVVCRMFNCARAKRPLPKYLSTDHDPLFRFHRWLANLRVLEIEEIKAVPLVPRSHPFVERMIRTIREELLGQVLFWNQLDLERKLSAFRIYYNRIVFTAESAAFRRRINEDSDTNGHCR